jgi:thymidylate kinase
MEMTCMVLELPAQVRDTKFVVLVGIDGSGKTTLLSRISLQGVITTSWRELRSHEVPATLAPDAPTRIKNRLPGLSRAMFIGGHLIAQYEYLVRPELEDGAHVVLDSYYLKLLAKERLFGTVHPALEDLCRELPQPDGIVYIDVPPQLSYQRKGGVLSPYEYDGTPTQANYIRFQAKLAGAIKKQMAQFPHIHVDGSADIGELVTRTEDAVKALLVESRIGGPVGQC